MNVTRTDSSSTLWSVGKDSVDSRRAATRRAIEADADVRNSIIVFPVVVDWRLSVSSLPYFLPCGAAPPPRLNRSYQYIDCHINYGKLGILVF